MSIEISLVKSPENVQSAKVCQVFTERGGSIGRSDDNTWVIEDPERYISSVHSRIDYEGGHYYLSDTSTNGTFLNGSPEPIGNGNRVLLKNGDKFILGDYEFSVSMPKEKETGLDHGTDPFSSGHFEHTPVQNNDGFNEFSDPFASYDDPFASQPPGAYADIEPLVPGGYEETDPLAALDKASHRHQENPFLPSLDVGNQPDNADAMQQAVSWPNMIPDDWNSDETSKHRIIEAREPEQRLKKRQPQAPVNRDVLNKLRDSEQKREALEIENEQLMSEVIQLKQKLKNIQNKPAAQKPVGQVSRFDGSLIDAMGLGDRKLSETKKAEISAIVGVLTRESIAGLMQALSFRKKIKEEFRINVTTIQPVENNPLKFSANIEDAIENMFIKDNKAYMNPLDAVKEGFQGISEHQVAVLAGIQAAFRGMIERLDPDALEKRFEKYRKTGVIKVGQKGKNWESYKEFHQDLVNNMDNSFQYFFGYDFVQAYEEQLQRLVMLRKAKANKH